MREIKFRAWDKVKEQMLEVRELTFLVDDHNVMCVEAWEPDAKEKSEVYLITLAPGMFELMQYTGLHDKNGRDIYEGDYLMHPKWGKQEVVYKYGGFGIDVKGVGGFTDGFTSFSTVSADYQNCEVTGNMYENEGGKE